MRIRKIKKIKTAKEWAFAVGMTLLFEVAFLMWILQPCSDVTIFLLLMGSSMALYWSLDLLEKWILARMQQKEEDQQKIKAHKGAKVNK